MRTGVKKRGYVSVLRKRPGRTAMELATTPMTERPIPGQLPRARRGLVQRLAPHPADLHHRLHRAVRLHRQSPQRALVGISRHPRRFHVRQNLRMGRAPLRDARCAEKRAAWERFKEYCAHSNWQEFRCEQFVRLMNGCVDATKIRPCPDGDLTCPVRSSEADRRAYNPCLGKLRSALYAELPHRPWTTWKSLEPASCLSTNRHSVFSAR